MDVENDTSSVHVLQDCLTAIPAWSNAIQVHKAEGIVAKYFDYSKDETVVVVVLTPPPGAIVTCQIDEHDTSVLRVKWEWTRQTRDPEFLLREELATPTVRSILMVAALKEKYKELCDKNGDAPQTECVIQLPCPVRVQKDCMLVHTKEATVNSTIVELIAETGVQNSELRTTFTNSARKTIASVSSSV
ncbi:hypothetical protein AC1031_014756 [Aphanomyces cochlioides]|nr:hypothetical protein AC1031_014756 [Aphanomyces cochlioides]